MKYPSVAFLCLVALTLACSIPAGTQPPATVPTATRSITPAATRLKTPTATSPALAKVIAFEALHVRSAPGYQAEIVGYLFLDEDVKLTGKCRDGWAEIRWKQDVAWVNSKFLSDNPCEENR